MLFAGAGMQTKKCGEMVSSGSTCTTGSTYTSASTQDVTTSFQQDCCQAVAPTCSNTVPATPGVKYDCSAQTPGAWVYDSVKDTSSPPDCCKVCLDAADGGAVAALHNPRMRCHSQLNQLLVLPCLILLPP